MLVVKVVHVISQDKFVKYFEKEKVSWIGYSLLPSKKSYWIAWALRVTETKTGSCIAQWTTKVWPEIKGVKYSHVCVSFTQT